MRSDQGKRGRGYQKGPHIVAERNGILYAYLPGPPPRRLSLGTRDHAEAQRAFARLLSEERLGHAVDERTLIDCAREWLAAPHGWTRRYAQTQRNRIKAAGKSLAGHGVVYPRDLSATVLDTWLTARRSAVTHRTINADMRALRSCVAWSAERGFCAANTALDDRPQLREAKRTRRRELPDPHEVARIFDALDALDAGGDRRRRGRSSGAIARALYATGVRVDELRRLTVGDMHDGAVWVRPEPGAAATSEPTKGHRERRIPLSPEGLEVVRVYLRAVDGRTRSWSESWLNRRLDAACAAAKVPTIDPHDLRRAAATEWHRAGTPVGVIAQWLGHAEIATTELYLGTYRSDRDVIAPTPRGLVASATGTLRNLRKEADHDSENVTKSDSPPASVASNSHPGIPAPPARIERATNALGKRRHR